ncbi:MAG: alanine dehydrogenase [Syntrophobacteraceae bacterium]
MLIGMPREIKNNEYRVPLTTPGVETLTEAGHRVLIEAGAGVGSGITDEAYRSAGAEIAPDAAAVFQKAEMILKVKEILPPEYDLLREGQIVFTYIHSAGNPEETQVLLDRKIIGIAYEDILTDDGRSPLLTPMSEIAGEVGILMGAYHMFTINGGSGILLGGSTGIEPAKVVIFGAGSVGLGAARSALGLGADTTIMDIDLERLRDVRQRIFPQAGTLFLNEFNVRQLLPRTDLLVNAVKWPPRSDRHILKRDMLKLMKRDALIVDISCDPGGAVETCRLTTHDEPVYEVDGIRHFCVPNLPSAVARTSSGALCNSILPYVLEIASSGWLAAVEKNIPLRRGLGFALGYLTFLSTAKAQDREYTSPETIIRMFGGSAGRPAANAED